MQNSARSCRQPAGAGNPGTVSLVIIDNSRETAELLSTALACSGLEIYSAASPAEGLDLIYSKHPQIVLTDLNMPEMSGMEVMERTSRFDPAIDVVLMAALPSAETAVEAIRKGACDYIEKPVDLSAFHERIGKLVEKARQYMRPASPRPDVFGDSQFEGIIGRSPVMWAMWSRIRRVAPHFKTALITGETGTGKDLVARALHRLSPASTGPYVVLNCSAVVETLFESELFGHVRGAFTGATRDKMGLFEYAHGGTLFLDEIGDMPLSTQSKLLRTLQNQEVLRVGAIASRKVDVQVIAATNRDLRVRVAEKQFREDLFYRISMIEIRTPPLTKRKEDLPLLERHFLKKFSRQFGKNIHGLSRRAQSALARHRWPGNVRELENVIGHACMMAPGGIVDIQDLPEYLGSHSGDGAGPSLPSLDTVQETKRQSTACAVAYAAAGMRS